jgi:coenzyme F420-reducing hydrogenase beta subunit
LTKEKKLPLYAYAAWSDDERVRTTSSSGGVFSEIARYVFAKGGVVVGAVMDKDLKVHHTFATDMQGLFPMRGSKYVQSNLTGIYSKVKEYLQTERFVLFTGTPCQVAGLYTFLKKDYPSLLTCDLVCHGVPSQKSFDTYCEKIGLKGKVAVVAFRYTQGWGLRMEKHLAKEVVLSQSIHKRTYVR